MRCRIGMAALSLALALLAAGLALAGIATSILAAGAIRRLAATPALAGPALAATVLKPLHGAEPGLEGWLRATLGQAHAAPWQVVFGINRPTDSARPSAAAAIAATPDADAAIVMAPVLHGPNRKVSQLINLRPAARHEVLVVADADILVPPHWLTAVTAPLADPGVGLVTCLYRGTAADGGFWSRLAALGLDWHFLPNAALGESLGKAEGCYGATMALRGETLDALGGFESLVGLLADDHALGAAVRRLGLRVVLAPVVPEHMMHEPGLAALFRHELRWGRTVRLLNPAGYLGLGLTHPLVPALACAALAPAWGWAVLALALASRLGLAVTVDRALGPGLDFRRLALLPLRDLLSFTIWAAGLARGTVTWQGRRFRMRPDGSMVEA